MFELLLIAQIGSTNPQIYEGYTVTPELQTNSILATYLRNIDSIEEWKGGSVYLDNDIYDVAYHSSITTNLSNSSIFTPEVRRISFYKDIDSDNPEKYIYQVDCENRTLNLTAYFQFWPTGELRNERRNFPDNPFSPTSELEQSLVTEVCSF